jgi:thiol:disulfide interchange protein DsbD
MNFLNNFETLLNTSPALGLLASLAGGILSSFSPCLYPLIPITLGIIGAAAANSKQKGFLLSLIYVSGIALTYTAIGIIAALGGKLFSLFFINPITFLLMGLIFIVLGLSGAGLISLNFFTFSGNYKKDGGLWALFVFGIISGFALIPCNLPILGALLSFIALKQNIVYGASALFLFSLGYGAILIILGTSISLVQKLPKQGKWLIIIKTVTGFLLLLMGIYFLIKSIKELLP